MDVEKIGMCHIPELIFICGCNGAGKSTLTYTMLKKNSDITFIDPDRIAKENKLSPIAAGREVSKITKDLIAQKISFIKESTLTSSFDFQIILLAKENDFKTNLFYVGLKNSDLAVMRVSGRFQAGGHTVPEEDIRRRYERSIENLIKAIQLVDSVYVYDNTSYYEPVAVFKSGVIASYSFNPSWFNSVHVALNLPEPEQKFSFEEVSTSKPRRRMR